MNLDLFTLLIALGALVAGFLGSLTGLGGGGVIVPLLTLGFGVFVVVLVALGGQMMYHGATGGFARG